MDLLVISKRRRRIYYLVLLMLGAVLVISLVLYALRQNINLFYTPSELFATAQIPTNRIRVGGLVQEGSIKNITKDNELAVQFVVTDLSRQIVVKYYGVLPDLFREGQGVIALGKIDANNIFLAEQILAKHDEKYQPPELVALFKQEQ